jgi:hypothetical protein
MRSPTKGETPQKEWLTQGTASRLSTHAARTSKKPAPFFTIQPLRISLLSMCGSKPVPQWGAGSWICSILCLTRIGNLENSMKEHGVSVCCPHRGLATPHVRVLGPRRWITEFSFIGLNGARVGVRQPMFHFACRRHAHACLCHTRCHFQVRLQRRR